MKRTNIPKRKITRSSSFPLSFFESFYQKHNRCNFTLSRSLFSFCSLLTGNIHVCICGERTTKKEQICTHTHIRLHTFRWHTLLTIEILLTKSNKIIRYHFDQISCLRLMKIHTIIEMEIHEQVNVFF